MLDKRCPWCGGLIDYQKLSWKEKRADGEFPFFQNMCPHCGREYCFRQDKWDQNPKAKNIFRRRVTKGYAAAAWGIVLICFMFQRRWIEAIITFIVGMSAVGLWLVLDRFFGTESFPCRKSPTDEEQSREPGYSCTAMFTWSNGADVDGMIQGRPYIPDYSIIPICLLDSDGKPASRIWCIVCERVKQPKGRSQEIFFHFVLPEAPKDQLQVGGRFVAFNHETPAAEGEILRVERYY